MVPTIKPNWFDVQGLDKITRTTTTVHIFSLINKGQDLLLHIKQFKYVAE